MAKDKPFGKITYTGRAFHQDAMEAMRGGDIVRGIIELVTNSDDSYASLDDHRRQKIIVEVEHRRSQPWKVVVRDRAAGMSADTMVERITKLGGRTSGFEKGEDKRGNLGRGAKDVAAFGDVNFRSIHKGMYSKLLLKSNGDWQLLENRKVAKKDRKDMGIPRGNGTVVEINALPSIRCPRHNTLKKKLIPHFQLRDILSDKLRKVELVNLNDGTRDLLPYEYPDVPAIFDEKIEIPGYEKAEVELRLYRLQQNYEETYHDPGRPNGILIKGKRAIYENTLFSFESNPYSGWFAGELRCEYIDQLARDYDDRLERGDPPDPSNPMPIITRHRDGLNDNHPFVSALYNAAETVLAKLIKDEEKKAKEELGELENQKTRSDLDRLAKEAGRLISEELKEIEAEELPEGEGGEVPPLAIIPEMAYAYIGEDRTLTVAARKSRVSVGDEVDITLEPEGVVQLLNQPVNLNEHSKRDDLLVGQIRLRPILEGESTLISAVVNRRRADAILEVRPPREIVEEVVEPPDTFMFERSSYRVSWGRGKDIYLIAPASVVAESGDSLSITSSDKGVLVDKPEATLKYDESLDYYKAKVRIEPRSPHASSELTARLDNLLDTAQVKVTRKEEGPALDIRLVPRSFGSYRATIEKEYDDKGNELRVIKIAGKHPAIRHVLGDGFEGQDTPACRLIMAEIVADVAARHVVGELYRMRRSTEEFDADRIYIEHYKRMKRFLPRFQRVLVGSQYLVPDYSAT